MSVGRSCSAQCLLCPETFVVKDISDHLYEHLKYKPFRCNDCGFKCTQQSDLDEHTFANDGHSGSQCIDQYKQWLIELIKKDMQFAAKHGKNELLKSKNIALLVASAPSTPANQPSLSNSTPQQQPIRRPTPRHPPAPAPSPPPAIVESSSSSSSDEDEARPPPRKAVSTVQKRRSDNKRTHSDEGESEDEDNFAKGIKKLERELDRHFECRLCHKLIRISLADRQKHVRDEHMAGMPPERPDYKRNMESTTKEAFPGLVWDCTQCRGCPTKKNIQSNPGRREHVVNLHHYYLNSLYCPVRGCPFKSCNPGSFKKHFSVVHSYIRWQMDQPAFYQECVEQRRRIYQISKLLFTVDLPFDKRRGSDEEEEEEREQLRALKAAAPTRPSPSRPAASKKPRSKSPSSEEDSDDDSDDDVPPKRKTTKEKEKVLMRNSKGNLELVEVSDEEEEDEKMNVDKEQIGSTPVTANSGVCTQEHIKREPSPEVKQEEEVRQEPMTPADVACIPLPPPLSMQTLATLRAAGLPPPPLPVGHVMHPPGHNSYPPFTPSPQQWTQRGGGAMNNAGYRRNYY